MTTTHEVAATAALCGTLGLSSLADELKKTADRLGRTGVAVAVIGLVSRGKSTLVNQLVGEEISKVSATPETARLISVQNGKLEASGLSTNGSVVALPTDPLEFAESLARSNEFDLRSATYSSPNRLPLGLTLIDTPGAHDPEGAINPAMTLLGESWNSAAATSGLHVVSVPPGAADADWRLHRMARDAFEDDVILVVKPTDRAVSATDVGDVADHIARHWSIEPITLLDGPPGAWGRGALAVLEHALLERVATQAKRRTEIERRAEHLVRDVELVLKDLPLQALARVSDQLLREVSSSIAGLVRNRRDTANQLALEEERRQATVNEERRRDFLDDSARQLAVNFDADSKQPQTALLTELLHLATDGSAVAARVLSATLAWSDKRLSTSGLSFEKVLSALPATTLHDAMNRVSWSQGRLEALIRVTNRTPGLYAELSAVLVPVLLEAPAKIDIGRVIELSTDSDLRGRATELEGVRAVRHLRQAIGATKSIEMPAIEQLVRSAERVERLLRPTAVKDGLDQTRTEMAQVVRAARNHVVRLLGQLALDLSKSPVEHPDSFEAQRALGQWAAAWVAKDDAVGSASVALFQPDGPLATWAKSSFDAVGTAVVASRQREAYGGTITVLSKLGFVLAVLLLAPSPPAGILIGVGSWVMLNVGSSMRDPRPWSHFYVPPPPPLPADFTAASLRGASCEASFPPPSLPSA